MSSSDPLLQPYQLRHLRLRNRFMSTAHEPAYTEDGMPKERYRLYHAEKAKGGIALTMIGGSSVVAKSAGPKRKVVVVGAGPAGLEAARVAGERGHEVVVFEAGAQAGGQVRVAAGLRRRREIMGIVEW